MTDQCAGVTVGSGAITTDGGPMVRMSENSIAGYLLDIPNGLQLYLVANGAYTPIGSAAPYAWAPGDVVQVCAVGTQITGWLNGVQKTAANDATFSSGRFGVFISGSSLPFGAFAGGD